MNIHQYAKALSVFFITVQKQWEQILLTLQFFRTHDLHPLDDHLLPLIRLTSCKLHQVQRQIIFTQNPSFFKKESIDYDRLALRMVSRFKQFFDKVLNRVKKEQFQGLQNQISALIINIEQEDSQNKLLVVHSYVSQFTNHHISCLQQALSKIIKKLELYQHIDLVELYPEVTTIRKFELEKYVELSSQQFSSLDQQPVQFADSFKKAKMHNLERQKRQILCRKLFSLYEVVKLDRIQFSNIYLDMLNLSSQTFRHKQMVNRNVHTQNSINKYRNIAHLQTRINNSFIRYHPFISNQNSAPKKTSFKIKSNPKKFHPLPLQQSKLPLTTFDVNKNETEKGKEIEKRMQKVGFLVWELPIWQPRINEGRKGKCKEDVDKKYRQRKVSQIKGRIIDNSSYLTLK